MPYKDLEARRAHHRAYAQAHRKEAAAYRKKHRKMKRVDDYVRYRANRAKFLKYQKDRYWAAKKIGKDPEVA